MKFLLSLFMLVALAFCSIQASPVMEDNNLPTFFSGNASYTIEDILQELRDNPNFGEDIQTEGERYPDIACVYSCLLIHWTIDLTTINIGTSVLPWICL